MAERKIHLSSAQQLEFISVSESITDDELEYYYMLTAEDLQIVGSHRGQENKLGFAMTICCLRHKGWPYLTMESVPDKVIRYVAEQISVDPSAITGYGDKRTSKSFHLMEICSYYGYRQEEAWPELTDFIHTCAFRLNDLMPILREVIRFSISRKIIPPKISTLARMAHDAVGKEEDRVFSSISGNLSTIQKEKLDNLLERSGGNTSNLFDMKEVSGRWNSSAFIETAEKLESIRDLEIPDTFKDIHPNLLKSLSKQAYRYTPFRLKRFSDDKRYALLAILMHQQRMWLTDMAIDLNDKILMMMESEAKKTASTFFLDKRDEIDKNYRYFHKLGEGIYDALENGTDLHLAVEKLTTKDELRFKLDSRYTPHEGERNYYEKMISNYPALRRYIPSMLKNITFNASGHMSGELLKALDIIGAAFGKKGSILPENMPTSFFNSDWLQQVKNKDGKIQKEAYVVPVMLELRRQLRAGDIWVKYSYKYSSLESMLVPEEDVDWDSLGVGSNFTEYMESRLNDMRNIYRTIELDLESFTKLKHKDNRLHPERLENDIPDGARSLNYGLYSILPRVTLPEISSSPGPTSQSIRPGSPPQSAAPAIAWSSFFCFSGPQ